MPSHTNIVPETANDHLGTIEALLFLGGPPVPANRIVELFGETNESQVVESVAQLNQQYFRQGRPYEIRRLRAGYQMVLRPEFAPVVRRLHGRGREVRLSVAAIEVLSLVAYRQPVTVQTIDSIRGVDSAAIVRQLRRRNLIEHDDGPEGGIRVGYVKTTRRFLELFHLASLEDLPRVQELEKA